MATKFKAATLLLCALCLASAFTPSMAKKGSVKCAEPTIVGTSGADRLKGTAEADVIAARAGSDVISGLGDADVICAGAGNDTVRGRGGKDTLWGGRGNDSLDGDGARDTAYGHRGNDTCTQVEVFYACL
jgi:RTX calcium-binding nonapeptide repeat (4 copies)